MRYLLFFIVLSSWAQQSKNIKGIVVDGATKEVIEYATVAVYHNDKLIDGTSTDKKGKFSLKIKSEFTYVEVSFIGYKTKKILRNDSMINGLMTIDLERDDTLDEIVINSEITSTQLKVDRKVVRPGRDALLSGSALDAFEQIAEIQVDLATGALTFRGSNNVVLLLNGKPTTLSATELLQQIPSGDIERIELITAPSAKYRANGTSGIIDIILKKDRSVGLNLNLASAVSDNHQNIGVSGNYGLSFMNVRFGSFITNRDVLNTQRVERSFTSGSEVLIFTPYDFSGKILNANVGVDLFFDEKNDLSLDYTYTDNVHDIQSNTLFSDVTNNTALTIDRILYHFHYTSRFNANYRRKFNEKDHYLEMDYNRTANNNRFPSRNDQNNAPIYSDEIINNNVLQSASFDYMFPINKDWRIETGGSFDHRDLVSSLILVPANQQSSFGRMDYDEQLLGMYALTHLNKNNIILQAGLRYENYSSKYTISQLSLNNSFHFSNLFPSIHLTYKLNDKNSLNLGYSKRISRPNFRHINPFQFGSPVSVFVGNPSLIPEKIDNFDIVFQTKGNTVHTSFNVFYRNQKDVILPVTSIEEETGVQTYSYRNTGVNDMYGLETTVRFKLRSFWTLLTTANFYYTDLRSSTENFNWRIRRSSSVQIRNTFKIGKKVTTDVTYLHTPKRQEPLLFVLPRNKVDVGIRASFLNNLLTVNLRVNDVFNTNNQKRTVVTEEFVQHDILSFQLWQRYYMLSLNYNFLQSKFKRRSRKNRNYNHGGAQH